MEENIPMRRAGQTEDIKAAAVFLASADSNYITGTTVIIDGGLSIHLGQGA
jgi:glucose 1-dehydrogenase